MLVKCKAGIYDSKVDPVMVILSHADKQNIAAMHNDCTKYCQFPDSYSAEEIMEWMNVPDKVLHPPV